MSRCHCSGKNNKRRNWRILTERPKLSCVNDVAVRQEKAVVQCRICREVWHTNLIEGLRNAK